jgi:alpha-L-arabinofuranosidase
LRAHIGSWLNSNTVFESVSNAFDIAAISESKRLEKPIETGRWYDVTIEVGADQVDCYLDGKLLMTYKEPQQFFSIAGKDDVTGDIIIKAVNASANPYQTGISLTGVTGLQSMGELISLRAASPEVENSFAAPTKYIPQTQTVEGITPFFEISFKPYSINVLRLHTK